MYIYFTASKDATISEQYPSSSFGQSSLLKVGRILDTDSDYKTLRSVLYFDVDYITSLTSSLYTASAKYYLKLFDVYSEDTKQSYDYNIELRQLSNTFVEGRGIEEDGYNTGAVSWIQKTSTTNWNTNGGDYWSDSPSVSESQYFENGTEDFYNEVTDYISYFYHGFLFKLIDSEESLDVEKIKYFYSKQSSTIFQPRLEVKFDDSIKDDKSRFIYRRYNNLYLYNYYDEQLGTGSITGAVKLSIFPSGINVSLKNYDCNLMYNNIYYASDVRITGSYINVSGGVSHSINYFRLKWYDGYNYEYNEYITGSYESSSESLGDDELIIACNNLKYSYKQDDIARFNFFIRKRYPEYSFGSGNEDLSNYIVPNMWYEIIDGLDSSQYYRFMPFDDSYTKLSYDKNGNYFNLNMCSFYPGRLYQIRLKYKVGNQTIIYPELFNFIVE